MEISNCSKLMCLTKASFWCSLLVVFAPAIALAQVISGVVYKAGTETVVASVSVYYGGSLTGTLTDENGEFQLPAKAGKTPLTISCVGYFSAVVNDYAAGQPIKVYLEPKVYQLREIVIGGDGMSRDDKVRLFTREFIGTSEYALSSTIQNIDAVEISYDKKNRTLIAYCDGPIEIENKMLGYHISYYLDKFVKTPTTTSFTGDFMFREVPGLKNSKIVRNRDDAYQGSRMQFIRSLSKNSFAGTGFKIFAAGYRPMQIDSIVKVKEPAEQVINLRSRLIISYRNEYTTRFATLAQTRPNSYINQSGFYDASLRWMGFMGSERVGDMLPYEYQSPAELKDSLKAIAKSSAAQPESNNSAQPTPTTVQLSEEQRLAKMLVLAPNNPLDRHLVVKKWQVPIYYKVYGSFGSAERNQEQSDRTDNLFRQMALLTGLEIMRTQVDSLVNFQILAGGKPQDFAKVISHEALEYFKQPDVIWYYNTSDNGFTSSAIHVEAGKAGPKGVVWSVLQKRIVKSFGFHNLYANYEHSIFHIKTSALPDKISDFDARMIRMLYNPKVRSGMNAKEFESALLEIK